MNKVCGKCGLKKSLRDFYKDISKKDGRASYCKICASKYQHIYRLANREKNIDYQREYQPVYYLANKLKRNKQQHAWHLANKDKVNKKSRKHNKTFASYSVCASQLNFAENVSEGPNGELVVLCTYCGKPHMPTNSAVRNRIRALNGEMRGEARLYCSESCKLACPSFHQKKYWKSSKAATSREVSAQFRQLILKRDNWICQRCGAGVEAELHVHHIEGAAQHPGMANDLENGITLCKNCHKHVHSQNGCKYHELRCQNSN